MRRSASILFALLLSLTPCAAALADPPTNSPSVSTTQPIVELPPNSPIRIWFADLASPDASIRDRAKTQLMGISRDELEGLRALVEQSRPLAPAQASAMHDIVVQAYLAGEVYASMPNQAFLGIRWSPQIKQELDAGPPRSGTLVEDRLPGFPSFQMLRNGDLIVGVLIDPDAPLEQPPNKLTPKPDDLMDAVTAAGPRQVVLIVLRDGQKLNVPIRLAPRPVQLRLLGDQTAQEAFIASRLHRADDFWQQRFVPLLRPSIS